MSTVVGIDLTKNLSFLTVTCPQGGSPPLPLDFNDKMMVADGAPLQVPAALMSALWPHVYAATLAGKSFDNANPRGLRDNVAKNDAVDKMVKQRISRAEGASQNGFETLGFFATAVVAGNVAGLPVAQLNRLTLGYIASRIVYNYVYISLQTNRRVAALRSLVWFVGIGLSMNLWIRSGLALMQR
ncbi:hypothetical protein HIM_01792 [Hirsutella minnesotensis 3608]|nr:hypothetical protein HIM_01792 [Hirsutella minnesotensis 3608]